MSFKCEYCGSEYKRESTLARHTCKNKMRWLQKDAQHVRLGLKFFNDWHRIAMGSRSNKDYKQFVESRYYGAFVRFGLYVLEARVIAPERYLEWLIRSRTNVDRWCKDSVYNAYLAEQSKKETAERALERFVMHAETWSERTGSHWSKYWDEVTPHTLVNDIKMGKVSPWVFLGYSRASKRLDDLLPEMLNEIADTIDLPFWQRKLELNKPTVKWIDEILEASGH